MMRDMENVFEYKYLFFLVCGEDCEVCECIFFFLFKFIFKKNSDYVF